MAVRFSVADGGFVQDLSAGGAKIEFRVNGQLENPDLEVVGAAAYTDGGFEINTATLAINGGQIGSFNLQVRSADLNGANEVTHISQTIMLGSAGVQGQTLTVGTPTIAANKIIRLYLQYVSGTPSSDISVTLE